MYKSKKKVKSIIKSLHQTGRKGIAWLVDPDKIFDYTEFTDEFDWVKSSKLDFIFVGGSHLSRDNFSEAVQAIRQIAGSIPLVIFPGSHMQVDGQADAILFLSLISGRNPEYLIGQQVQAAPIIKACDIEVLPTAYLLVSSGGVTSVSYVSQTIPIPNAKPHLAASTALAGKYLGMKYFFLDAGSGAATPVSADVIQAVKNSTQSPLVVGGGINSTEKLQASFEAGADIAVIGNAIENNSEVLREFLDFKNHLNLSLNVN